MKPIFLGLGAVGLALAGCATISSTGDFSSPDLLKTASGSYHLPRTVLTVKVTPAASADTLASISVSASTEADPQAAILFQIEHSPLADDTIEVKTDNTGLLTSVNSQSADRTGDIAVSIARLVFSSMTGADPTSVGPRALPTGGNSLPGFAASYDPLDVKQAWTVRQGLNAAGFCILVGPEVAERMSVGAERTCSKRPIPDNSGLIAASYAGKNPGIYYRRPTPLPVEIYQRAKSGALKLVFAGNELFFDKSALYRVDVDRAAFVTKSVVLTFTSGALTAIKVTNPSEILGGLQSAVSVAQIIFAIPLSGLKQQQSLTDAQTNLMNSQVNFLNTRQKLLSLEAQQSTDGRTLSFTPSYSLTGRNLTVSGADNAASSVDDCVKKTGMTREQCITAINNDAVSH